MSKDKQDSLEEMIEETTEDTQEEKMEKPSADAGLLEKIEKLEEENGQLKDKFLRAHAEMENVRRRAQVDMEKSAKFGLASFAKELLPVADNMERALQAVPEDADSDALKNLIAGIEMTQQAVKKAFESVGIVEIDHDGVFDPNHHQVVQEVEDPTQTAGTIVSTLQTGYMIKDRLLREAMVVVTRGGPKPSEKELPPGEKIDTTA